MDWHNQHETYAIIGVCMEAHKKLGAGSLEIIYKDAIEYEIKTRGIPYLREKEYLINYKDTILSRCYKADFVVFDKIILEVKAQEGALEGNFRQVLNYLAVSKCKLGLLVNFAKDSLEHRRLIF